MSKSYSLADESVRGLEEARLEGQARLLFDVELAGLPWGTIQNVQNVIDLGTGNGAYLSMFKHKLPNAKLIGVDRNEFLLQKGLERHGDIVFKHQDIISFTSENLSSTPTLYVLRFVLQHLSVVDQIKVVRNLKKNNPGSKLLIIDVDDKKFESNDPRATKWHQNLVKKQHANGGNRFVVDGLLARTGLDECDVASNDDVWYTASTIGNQRMCDIFVELLIINSPEKENLDLKQREVISNSIKFFSKMLLINL